MTRRLGSMQNMIVSSVLSGMADLLEIVGEESFKVRAYRRAAESVDKLSGDIAEYSEHNRLLEIPGVGKNLAEKIKEIVETGTCHQYEELKSKVPHGVLDLLRIPGLGPKSASALFFQIGVKSLQDLKEAISKHKVREIKGFGARKEEMIKKGLEQLQDTGNKILLGTAWPLAEEIAGALRRADGVERIEVAGSVRRRKEMVADIDFVISAEDSACVMNAFTSLPIVKEVIACGPTKASIRTGFGVQIDARAVQPQQFWAAWHHFTGSKAHHIRLRGMAKDQGLKINEYGIWDDDLQCASVIPLQSEEDIYSHLGLQYIPPELREDSGEIEAAAGNNLPFLIQQGGIKGDLHVHSSWSDGIDDIRQMAYAAAQKGYEYIAITDHSKSLTVANGLNEDRLRQQIELINEINASLEGIKILKGIEVDILRSGALDMDDSILEQLDIVVASLHSGFSQDENTVTNRLVRAMKNPNVDIIGHLSGRLMGKRNPCPVNFEEVLDVAEETNTILEINSSPDRLDINDTLARRAKERGIKIAISTDAHSSYGLNDMKYGVAVARRGWLEAGDVVNTMSYGEIREYLASHKQR